MRVKPPSYPLGMSLPGHAILATGWCGALGTTWRRTKPWFVQSAREKTPGRSKRWIIERVVKKDRWKQGEITPEPKGMEPGHSWYVTGGANGHSGSRLIDGSYSVNQTVSSIRNLVIHIHSSQEVWRSRDRQTVQMEEEVSKSESLPVIGRTGAYVCLSLKGRRLETGVSRQRREVNQWKYDIQRRRKARSVLIGNLPVNGTLLTGTRFNPELIGYRPGLQRRPVKENGIWYNDLIIYWPTRTRWNCWQCGLSPKTGVNVLRVSTANFGILRPTRCGQF